MNEKRIIFGVLNVKKLSRKQLKGKPLCERCWPGILPSNTEAWEVYLMARMDEMGITVSGIETSCRILGVNDPIECCIKVRNYFLLLGK